MPLKDLDRFALDNLTTAVLLLDPALNIIHTNPAAETLLAISAMQLQGCSFCAFLPGDNAGAELRNVLNTQSSYTHRAIELQVPGNGATTVDFTATPASRQLLLIELQSVDRILKINREEALLSAQTTSRELVRGLAHEVKNPLAGIKGAAQLLGMELDSEQREYTNLIIAESDRLCHLVDQLLGPSQPLRNDPLNIHLITEHVATLIEAEAHSHEQQPTITIQRDYDPSIPELPGDRDQLIQALLNIARNALQVLINNTADHNSCIILRTRIQRHFTIGKVQHKIVCRIDIIDNGPGIDPQLVERIFYPMISGRSGGSGLGLPIAQTIISRHQGLIECSSQPGETRFSIFLPLRNSND